MHTVIILVHVIAMVSSLSLVGSAVGLGLLGKRIAGVLATLGLGATAVGGFSGILLLLDAPLSLQCALLTGYLAAVTLVYVYGFAMGDVDRARLIRSTVKN
jgi:hypothetical protein